MEARPIPTGPIDAADTYFGAQVAALERLLRANPYVASFLGPGHYAAKAARWRATWPGLRVEPW
ncbi:MAG TPA: hypothetical protein VIL48_00085 [Acidimicrobiales bacterium]